MLRTIRYHSQLNKTTPDQPIPLSAKQDHSRPTLPCMPTPNHTTHFNLPQVLKFNTIALQASITITNITVTPMTLYTITQFMKEN